MANLASCFILGYHGCDQEVGKALLQGEKFKKSENDYDWLGHGIYFWEANPKRGYDFAIGLKANPRPSYRVKVRTPFVIGAIIDLGHCLDLTSLDGIQRIEVGYHTFKKAFRNKALPKNEKNLVHRLDCAVIEFLHQSIRPSLLQETGDYQYRPFETVKAVFVEGREIYPTSAFHAGTHIQICVREPKNIKGVFRVPTEHYL